MRHHQRARARSRDRGLPDAVCLLRRWRRPAEPPSPARRRRLAASTTGDGIGDPYYPDDGNRGYDVARLRRRSRLLPRRRSRSRATTTVTATATEPPATLPPRPARPDGHRGHGRRSAGRLRARRRARAGDHAVDADRRRSPLRHAGHLPRQARRETRGDQVASGWFDADHARRRLHRRRAALVHVLVPVQRPPDRQGDVRAASDRAAAVRRSSPSVPSCR